MYPTILCHHSTILTESLVRSNTDNSFPAAEKPPGPLVRKAIELRHIRFDIKQRCPVNNVNILDDQFAVVHRDEPHDREADCVRTAGSPGGKDAVRYSIKEWDHIKRVAMRTVEVVEQDDPGKPAQILQTVPEFFIDIYSPPYPGRTRRLDRHTGRFSERGVDGPYGSKGNYKFCMWIHCESPWIGYPENSENRTTN